MGKEKKLLKREECDKRYQWHIEDLYASDELWEKDYEALEKEIPELSSYEGRLKEGYDTFLSYERKKEELLKKFEAVYVYANQKYHEDTGNATYQKLCARAQNLSLMVNNATVFEEPELLDIGEETIGTWMEASEDMQVYRRYFYELFRQQKHVLSKEMEAVLADVSDMSGDISNIFSMFNNADVRFPDIKGKDGQDIAVTHGRYTSLMESRDREMRKDAFTSLYSQYGQFKNTLAGTYSANLKSTAFFAKMRKYDSGLAMALDGNEIPISVYTELIDTVHDHMDLMHRYVRLRKKALGVEELHMYDLYAPMVDEVEMKIPFEEAKEIVAKGLAPLGEDYIKVLTEGMNGGWIDVYENEGKRSGAYSWGAYGTHPFVLMNYQDTLNHVFTLAHEMGHSMHSYYSDKNQPYPYAGYCIFVAEVASTCNEALLMEYLLGHTEDKKEKAYLINYFLEQFKGTLYRQTMFAEFEKITHEMAQNKEPLTAEVLNDIYYKLNEQYFGEDIVIDPEIALEWARIPHFYTPFYVYQYATGYSAAIAISRKILSGDEKTKEGYFKFLSGGSSRNPIELLKLCGVDMTTKEPVESALKLFGELLDQMEELL
ncbi:MAG: oligoendopeptidase F [Lachnospiraceae bacterium]|nr:oligoendopeptidase F [Lachnospiraceae bacterium]